MLNGETPSRRCNCSRREMASDKAKSKVNTRPSVRSNNPGPASLAWPRQTAKTWTTLYKYYRTPLRYSSLVNLFALYCFSSRHNRPGGVCIAFVFSLLANRAGSSNVPQHLHLETSVPILWENFYRNFGQFLGFERVFYSRASGCGDSFLDEKFAE